MPSSISNPTRSNLTRHRAQIMAEAVVSAYIHELAQPSRPRERGEAHTDLVSATRAVMSSSPRARPLGRARGAALERRRRQALELAA